LIASVRGKVLVRRPDHVVVEAAGVGYRLAVSAETLKSVPACGTEVTLHAHLVAREDSLALYGFGTEEERDLFLHLTSVSGVGPKVALAILSGGTPRELLRAIAGGDAKRFQAAPGVGKRTAERLIVELREKVADELTEGMPAVADVEGGDARALARDGLMHLGYTITESERLLDGVSGSSAEELIASALRRAGERGAAAAPGART
jgi:holliday junction DNA helicase RuvA